MHGKSNYIRIRRKPFFVVLFIFILAIATPVLADYLGPHRTITETTGVCKVVLYECQYVASKNLWKYKKADDWSCSNEGKLWQGVDNYDGECGPFSDGRTQWGKEEILQTVTTTHPEATIASALQGCNLNNGWCNTASELSLNGTEPLSGYSILAVEGSLNGQTFACSGDNCSVPLNEGNNDFTFWAISSWGDSSSMGTFSAKVDTVLPTLGLNITATSGSNGWYVSPTSLTATGSDSTSGLSSVFLSVDNGAWQPSIILNEGVYNILVQAEDNAGNIAQSSTVVSVDMTTPTIAVSVNGTTGNNGWYSSNMEVSATANDATSGVGSLESSLDGGVYQAYNSPVSFADGYHTVQFKAIDKAGNETETSVQEFYVDTITPAVDLPAEWEVNDTITYKVQDDGSGLSALRIVIEDEDEKFAKVAWDEFVSGNKFKGEITWNGKFKDETIAPPGEYLVWVKVTDTAGNERIGSGRVIVPSLFSLFSPSKSSTEIPTPPADLFDSDNLSTTISNPDPSTSPSTSFGGSTTPTNSSSVQSLTLSSDTASTSTTTSTNVLWGATAAALIGWATASALEEQKKRKEAEARRQEEGAARKRANAASHQANRDEYPPLTRQEKELAKQRKELQKIWDANGAAIYEANREYQAKHGKEMDATARSKAIKDATMNGVFNAGTYASTLEAEKTRQDAQNERMADKMTRFEREEEVRWQASQKAAEKKQKAEELQAGLTAYYAATKPPEQKEKEGEPKVSAALAWDNDPPPSKWGAFWQGVTNWWNNLFVIKQPTPTPDVSAIQTQAAKTFIAQLTQTAQATPTSTPTAMPTFTLTPTSGPSLGIPMIVLADGLNLRLQPNTYTPPLMSIPKGKIVNLVQNSELVVSEGYCWANVIYTNPDINPKAIPNPQFLNPLTDFVRLTSFLKPIEYYNAMPGVWANKHIGEDYAPLPGTNNPNPSILASTFGIVSYSGKQVSKDGNLQGYGNYLIVEYPANSLSESIRNLPEFKDKQDNSLYAMYAHLLNDVSDVLPTGTEVESGMPIGNMGMSGNGGGIVHLHFELRLGEAHSNVNGSNGTWYDPVTLLPIDPAFIITPTDTQIGWVVQTQWDAQSQCATGEQYLDVP